MKIVMLMNERPHMQDLRSFFLNLIRSTWQVESPTNENLSWLLSPATNPLFRPVAQSEEEILGHGNLSHQLSLHKHIFFHKNIATERNRNAREQSNKDTEKSFTTVFRLANFCLLFFRSQFYHKRIYIQTFFRLAIICSSLFSSMRNFASHFFRAHFFSSTHFFVLFLLKNDCDIYYLLRCPQPTGVSATASRDEPLTYSAVLTRIKTNRVQRYSELSLEAIRAELIGLSFEPSPSQGQPRASGQPRVKPSQPPTWATFQAKPVLEQSWADSQAWARPGGYS